MERVNPRCGFLKCGRRFVRKIRPFPGDNYGRSPTNIRDKEEGITDTRTIGYNQEIPFGAAICSFIGWGQKVFDEEERLRDPRKSFIPFEELMIAELDGTPFHVAGDDIVDEIYDIEESLAEILEEDRFDFMSQLKPGKILAWHYPQPYPPDLSEIECSGNHGKIYTERGEVTIFYKRKKIPFAKPEPEKKLPVNTPFPPSPPKKMDLRVLGSLLNAKKMPQLHQIAMMAKR